MEKIAVFGASGHVGATLVEELLAAGHYEVRPIIRSSGNAWGLACQGLQLWQADMANYDEVLTAIKDCDYVVNCARNLGPSSPRCTNNVLKAAAELRVKRFVHLSSVAVYGEFPKPECESEQAQPLPVKNTYGWTKLQQDLLVEKACRRGLPCVVLCPPNITGRNSYYLLEILDAMRRATLALVDDGERICELVDVRNLTHAIRLGLRCDQADGRRIFITDNEDTRWRDVAARLRPIVDEEIAEPPSISEQDARRIYQRDSVELSLIQVLRQTLTSTQARETAQKSALANWLYAQTKDMAERLPSRWSSRISARMRGRGPVGKRDLTPSYSGRLCAHQLRNVRHSCQRAKDVLGYQPAIRFPHSMDVFCEWYRQTHAFGSDDWTLLRELYPPRALVAHS